MEIMRVRIKNGTMALLTNILGNIRIMRYGENMPRYLHGERFLSIYLRIIVNGDI